MGGIPRRREGLRRCRIGKRQGQRDLSEREGVELVLYGRRKKIFTLLGGQGNEEDRRRHRRILQFSPLKSRETLAVGRAMERDDFERAQEIELTR
ncbi:hypothetical protein EBS57_08335 [bacterium]|nr:hypothetical protein [bacterium]